MIIKFEQEIFRFSKHDFIHFSDTLGIDDHVLVLGLLRFEKPIWDCLFFIP